MRRLTPVLTACFVLAFLISGCKKEQPQRGGSPAVDSPKEKPKTPPVTDDKIGVPECDDYLDKYTACVEQKVPETARPMMEKNLTTMREAWRKAATSPAGRQELAQTCKTAAAAATKAMQGFGCEW